MWLNSQTHNKVSSVSFGNRRFDEVNDKLDVKICVSKNLTFPQKSHQRAKTSL